MVLHAFSPVKLLFPSPLLSRASKGVLPLFLDDRSADVRSCAPPARLPLTRLFLLRSFVKLEPGSTVVYPKLLRDIQEAAAPSGEPAPHAAEPPARPDEAQPAAVDDSDEEEEGDEGGAEEGDDEEGSEEGGPPEPAGGDRYDIDDPFIDDDDDLDEEEAGKAKHEGFFINQARGCGRTLRFAYA